MSGITDKTTGTINDEKAQQHGPRGRGLLIALMIGALVVSATLQQTAYRVRDNLMNANRPRGAVVKSRISNLDSFSLALMLGGLRGPLVMFLWSNSETNKGDKNLESFDTQVELIRLLQPEFVTVHLFQIWNKAYNTSVQYASLSNKYSAVVDALEYAERVNESDPNNVNIITAIAGLYSEKLGKSAEKEYYNRRVRMESLPVFRVTFPTARTEDLKKYAAQAGVDLARIRIVNQPGGESFVTMEKQVGERLAGTFKGEGIKFNAVTRQSLRLTGSSGRRTELDTVLDAAGNLRPEFVAPALAGVKDADADNGAPLQFLKKFEPFPYGVSPLAFGYNYSKRGQLLQRDGKQKHVQMGEVVVDNQAPLALKFWGEEEGDRARKLEERGVVLPAGIDPNWVPEMKTAGIAPNVKVLDRAAVNEAIFSYQLASQISGAVLPEFDSHIVNFPQNQQNYSSHRDDVKAFHFQMLGEVAYLKAVVSEDAAEKAKLLAQAKEAYKESAKWWLVLMLKYNTDEWDAAGSKYERATVEQKTLPELREILANLETYLVGKYKTLVDSPKHSDRAEYMVHIARIDQRLAKIP